jgi:LysR family glycine cleavage system transcriptional activator
MARTEAGLDGNGRGTARRAIDRRWLPLNALRAFEAVGRQLSFTAGAQALSVSQSAISRHVIGLEALLGVKLFERQAPGLAQGLAQGVVLTRAGEVLLPLVSRSLDRMEQALNDILGDQGGQRSLMVHLPPSFAQLLAVPLLRDLRRELPGIGLDIATPGMVGPPPQEVDAAVLFTHRPPSAEGIDLLWMVQVSPMCHPNYARRHRLPSIGEPVAVELARFLDGTELLHVRLERQPRYLLWENFARQCGLGIDVARGLAFDTAALAAQYALSGEGVALLDTRLFAAELASGRLVAPFDVAAADGFGYFLSIAAEDLADPVVALFRDWIIRRFAGTVRSDDVPIAPGETA